MKLFLVGLLISSQSLWAQGLVSDLEKINQEVGQTAMDEFVKSPSREGIDGSILSTLLPSTNVDPKNFCPEEQEVESESTRYEVILITEVSGQQTRENNIKHGLYYPDADLQLFKQVEPLKPGLSTNEVLKHAEKVWERGYVINQSEKFDPHSNGGREIFIESLIHAANGSTLSEKDLSRLMAKVVGVTYKTDEQRYNFLSSLSMRLYRNYNDARNPGANHSVNNPDGKPLPKGDMTIQDLFTAAVNFDPISGGVCNDISEAVAMVGEHLFPDKDVLVINSGSHFGVAVVDEGSRRIIDGGMEYQLENQLYLNPEMSPTNIRISKVQNGALKEIAVVDTQMGELTEAAFRTGKNLLKTDADISTVIVHYQRKNLGLSAGTGKLTDSNVVVVVAKYETAGDKWKSHIGVGATRQDYISNLENKYQVHFRAGVERNVFHYVNSKASVNFTTGLRVNGMYALGQDKESTLPLDFSVGSELVNRLNVTYGKHKRSGLQVHSSVEVEHFAGARNWGNITGAMSDPNINGKTFGKVLKNMTFRLNQINSTVTGEKKINEKVSTYTSINYQGSSVGQSVGILTGLDIKAPEGAQILVFTGYRKADIKGFQTQHGLLAAPPGLEVGGIYKTKKGLEVGGAVRGISEEPSVNGTIRINLNKKRR